jgi:hypothetical protein
MASAGFESAIPVIEWPQTYALDRGATGIGQFLLLPLLIVPSLPIPHLFLLVLLLFPPPLLPTVIQSSLSDRNLRNVPEARIVSSFFAISLRRTATAVTAHSHQKATHKQTFFVSYLDHGMIQCAVLTLHEEPPLIPCYIPVCSAYIT